jgi:hypothetical protein
MEVPQEHSLCSYLKQQNCHLFFLSFAKSEHRREEKILPEGADTSGRGEEVRKGCKRVNMVQIVCTHECKQKKDTC